MKILFLGLLLTVPAFAKPTLFDALVGRVGQEAVTLNDLTRFRDIEGVMSCAGLRKKVNDADMQSTLRRYVDEELFYLEARAKKQSSSGELTDTIESIRSKKACRDDWNQLGKLYGKAWETDARPREGEGLLVRELEKRLLVDHFQKTENLGERAEWIREAKIRHPVKLYLE
jgi:hypothetical protein